jgi:transcriptional regulator with GAF, ATPase, and Fis domain
MPFAEAERQLLQRALERTHGKIYGDDGAAALLRLKPTTLQAKLKKHRLK